MWFFLPADFCVTTDGMSIRISPSKPLKIHVSILEIIRECMICLYSTLISINFLLHNSTFLKSKQYHWVLSRRNEKISIVKSKVWQLSHYITYQVPYHKDDAPGNFQIKVVITRNFFPNNFPKTNIVFNYYSFSQFLNSNWVLCFYITINTHLLNSSSQEICLSSTLKRQNLYIFVVNYKYEFSPIQFHRTK